MTLRIGTFNEYVLVEMREDMRKTYINGITSSFGKNVDEIYILEIQIQMDL